MKKSIFTLIIAPIAIGLIVTGCKLNAEKEREGQINADSANVAVTQTEENMSQSKMATAEEWQTFKDQTNQKINENNARIAELKLKVKNTGKDIDNAYQRSIDTIELKNNNLKTKIDSYKNDANSDWQSFKTEFSHDMDALGNSLKDFSVDNKN